MVLSVMAPTVVRTIGNPVNNRVGSDRRIAAPNAFCQIEATDGSSGASVQSPTPHGRAPPLPRGATVTTRYERIKMQRRMRWRIRLAVEERRMAAAVAPNFGADAEITVELPPRAIGRIPVETL